MSTTMDTDRDLRSLVRLTKAYLSDFKVSYDDEQIIFMLQHTVGKDDNEHAWNAAAQLSNQSNIYNYVPQSLGDDDVSVDTEVNESASGGSVVDTRINLEDTNGACNEGSGQPNLDSHDTSGGGVGVAPNNPDNNMEVGSSGGEDTKGKGDGRVVSLFDGGDIDKRSTSIDSYDAITMPNQEGEWLSKNKTSKEIEQCKMMAKIQRAMIQQGHQVDPKVVSGQVVYSFPGASTANPTSDDAPLSPPSASVQTRAVGKREEIQTTPEPDTSHVRKIRGTQGTPNTAEKLRTPRTKKALANLDNAEPRGYSECKVGTSNLRGRSEAMVVSGTTAGSYETKSAAVASSSPPPRAKSAPLENSEDYNTESEAAVTTAAVASSGRIQRTRTQTKFSMPMKDPFQCNFSESENDTDRSSEESESDDVDASIGEESEVSSEDYNTELEFSGSESSDDEEAPLLKRKKSATKKKKKFSTNASATSTASAAVPHTIAAAAVASSGLIQRFFKKKKKALPKSKTRTSTNAQNGSPERGKPKSTSTASAVAASAAPRNNSMSDGFTTDQLKMAAQQSGSGSADRHSSQLLDSFTSDQMRALIEAKDAYPTSGMGASSAFNSAVSKCTKLKIPRVQITGFMRKYATRVFGDNWNGRRNENDSMPKGKSEWTKLNRLVRDALKEGSAEPGNGDIVVQMYSGSISCSNASINDAVNGRLKDFDSGNDTEKETIAKKIMTNHLKSGARMLEKYANGTHKELDEAECIDYVKKLFNRKISDHNYYEENREAKKISHHNHYEENCEAYKARNRANYAANADSINSGKREERRVIRLQASTATAERMCAREEEDKESGDSGKVSIMMVLDPPIVTVPSSSDSSKIDFKTPTPDNPNELNNADALKKYGCGILNVYPAMMHVSRVPPDRMQKTNDEVLILGNEHLSEKTKAELSGAMKMLKASNHLDHDTPFTGIGLVSLVHFHFRHWKTVYKWKDGEVLYIYLFFKNGDAYDSFDQVRWGGRGKICPSHALMSKSIVPAAPCACLQVTLGEDQVKLKDTKYKFIRINGNMKSEVNLELNDPKLVVSRYGIKMKD